MLNILRHGDQQQWGAGLTRASGAFTFNNYKSILIQIVIGSNNVALLKMNVFSLTHFNSNID